MAAHRKVDLRPYDDVRRSYVDRVYALYADKVYLDRVVAVSRVHVVSDQ